MSYKDHDVEIPKEAMFYEKLSGKDKNEIKDKQAVQCHLCPNNCMIMQGKRGSCGVRENHDGTLYSMVYGKLVAASTDPIEKKPLFHFMPNTNTLSIATSGCNLHCMWCQNWDISQIDHNEAHSYDMTPEGVVKKALKEKCQSISYTYVEPAIFYEFVLDVAELARKKGLKNVLVSNGYLNPEPIKKLYRHIDAVNIDLKGFTEEFYRKYCSARLKPVLDAIIQIKEMGIWLELTTLIIPGKNDDMQLIKKMCLWIKDNVGTDVPLHFSRFHPAYKMQNVKPTPLATLEQAYKIAKQTGIKHVYIGNVREEEKEHTICPKCSETLIKRSAFFHVYENKLSQGKCPGCGEKIAGVWK